MWHQNCWCKANWLELGLGYGTTAGSMLQTPLRPCPPMDILSASICLQPSHPHWGLTPAELSQHCPSLSGLCGGHPRPSSSDCTDVPYSTFATLFGQHYWHVQAEMQGWTAPTVTYFLFSTGPGGKCRDYLHNARADETHPKKELMAFLKLTL